MNKNINNGHRILSHQLVSPGDVESGDGKKKRATKKGIVITIIIVVAVVATSFLVYLIP